MDIASVYKPPSDTSSSKTSSSSSSGSEEGSKSEISISCYYFLGILIKLRLFESDIKQSRYYGLVYQAIRG